MVRIDMGQPNRASPLRPSPDLLAEIAALPPQMTGEVIGGELIVSPRPNTAHSDSAAGVSEDLRLPFQRGRGGPGGWVILVEPELHLGRDVLVPDLAAWRVERLPDARSHVAVEIVPDWIGEVLSPSTARRDRGTKLRAYGDHGVGWAWLIDPEAETVEVYERVRDRWAVHTVAGGDEVARLAPFDAVALSLSWWWGRPPPEPEGPAPDDAG